MSGKVAVGVALKPHGLKGAIRVEPWLDDLDAYGRIEEVFSQDEPSRRFEVAACHRGGRGAVVWKFAGIDAPKTPRRCGGLFFWRTGNSWMAPMRGFSISRISKAAKSPTNRAACSGVWWTCSEPAETTLSSSARRGRRVAHARNARGRIEARGRALDFPSP